MPHRLLRSYRVRWALVIFITYWALVPFVEALALIQAMTLLMFGVAASVIYKYTRPVVEATLHDDRTPRSKLATGAWLGFVGLLLSVSWAIAGRLIPGAEWMQRSPVIGFFFLIYVIAGAMHVTASNENTRRRDLWVLLMGLGAGLLLALLFLALQAGDVLRRP